MAAQAAPRADERVHRIAERGRRRVPPRDRGGRGGPDPQCRTEDRPALPVRRGYDDRRTRLRGPPPDRRRARRARQGAARPDTRSGHGRHERRVRHPRDRPTRGDRPDPPRDRRPAGLRPALPRAERRTDPAERALPRHRRQLDLERDAEAGVRRHPWARPAHVVPTRAGA